MLNRLPHFVDLLDRALTEGPLVHRRKSLMNLLDARSTNDDRIAMLRLQWAVVSHPSLVNELASPHNTRPLGGSYISQLRLGDSFIFGNGIPLLKCLKIGRFPVEFKIHLANWLLGIEAAFSFGDVLLGLSQETSGHWAVGVETDTQLS